MGPDPLLFFIITIIGVVTAVVVWAAFVANRKERERLEAVMREVAAQVGGRVVAGTWTRQPSLLFEHASRSAKTEFYSTGGKNPVFYTRLILDVAGLPDLRMHIYPEGFFSRIGKALGAQDIQVGDQLFDSSYMIKGSDRDRVTAFLTPPIRQAVYEVRSLHNNSALEIMARGDKLVIQKLHWLKAPDLLLHFIRANRQILDGYLQALAGEPSSGKIDLPICAVCDHPVEGSSQRCSRCDAIHHPECWHLNDGCGNCGALV